MVPACETVRSMQTKKNQNTCRPFCKEELLKTNKEPKMGACSVIHKIMGSVPDSAGLMQQYNGPKIPLGVMSAGTRYCPFPKHDSMWGGNAPLLTASVFSCCCYKLPSSTAHWFYKVKWIAVLSFWPCILSLKQSYLANHYCHHLIHNVYASFTLLPGALLRKLENWLTGRKYLLLFLKLL